MIKFLLLGERSVQHSLAVRLEREGNRVHVFPGQDFKGYKIVTNPVVDDYDCIVVGSTRYFNHPIIKEALKSNSCCVFGVDVKAGRLEISKSFFSNFAKQNNLKNAESCSFSDIKKALNYIRNNKPPYVIKADGPASGCGVCIAHNYKEAKKDLQKKLVDKKSQYYSGSVIIEKFINGFEIAVNIFMDGENYIILPPTRPHKQRNNNDKGPNVAGMGSFAPVSLNEDFYKKFREEVIEPTMDAIRSKGWYFRGCLFINLMLNNHGIYILEFNCRMGDPAMLVDIELLKSSLSELLLHTAKGTLSEITPIFKKGFAVATTIVQSEYPDMGQKKGPFVLPKKNTKSKLFLAGLHSTSHGLFSNNGVIGSAVAYNISREIAKKNSYTLAHEFINTNSNIDLDCRSDIGNLVEPPSIFYLSKKKD